MKTRPCVGGGVLTAVPDWSDPEVIGWGPNEIDSRATAGSAYVRHKERSEKEQAELAQEFAAQQWAEYRKIRARA